MGRVRFDPLSFFPWDGRSPESHPTCNVPFPPKETRRILERDDARYQGVRRSVWDTETSRERVGDWGGPETVWALLCVAERRATRPNGEWDTVLAAICWATSAQRRCHPKEAMYFQTFSHLLIFNKLLSLSPPPSPPPFLLLLLFQRLHTRPSRGT